MVQRAVALCNGKYIGIETIYTVINGQQINIPEKIEALRAKSRNKELFCPCGCGANLVLVAGDKNLRRQHFKIKDGEFNQVCSVVTEGKTSVDSKIVLKCWLDDKLKAEDMEARVLIHAVDDVDRKYEFSYLSQSKKIAISYCHERVNLSDEKLGILESNSRGIHIIYIVDSQNGGSVGQYPESLMKVQSKQGYCLLLTVGKVDYNEAELKAVFYVQNIDGLWQEVTFAEGLLRDFCINDDGQILYLNELLTSKLSEAKSEFALSIEREKVRREEEDKRKREEYRKQQEEAEKERRCQAEEIAKHRAEIEEKRRLEEKRRQVERRQREEDFKRNMESNFSQQETQVRDANGNRWIKCEICGKIAMENKFNSYGGIGHINLGICKECSSNRRVLKQT